MKPTGELGEEGRLGSLCVRKPMLLLFVRFQLCAQVPALDMEPLNLVCEHQDRSPGSTEFRTGVAAG